MSRWRERLADFDRDVLQPRRDREPPGAPPPYATLASTFRLPLLGGVALAVLFTVLELVLVRRPLGTVAFLVVGLLLGLAVGAGSARALRRLATDPRAVDELPPGAGRVVPHRLEPRVLAIAGLVVGLALLAPVVLDFPTPFGPFAAALAVQSFLVRRAVADVEEERGATLLSPADRLAVDEESLRWESPSALA